MSGAEAHTASTEHHAEPLFLGFAPPVAIVSTSMIVLLAILAWKGVPKLVTGGLDAKIAEIKTQLAEAKALRAEAEALRKEYADKIAGAEKDAVSMLEHARHEAEAIVAKAEKDTAEAIARREKMAQQKIAAAELTAVTSLRNQAAAAAAAAATHLISANHSADADKVLVDQAIAGI
ncbi:ATP synthase subunit B [Novosphingobium sp. Leaf2]|nr:ATP synthase subunit B [Novosphingobium sp. Leaf2]